MLSFSPSLNVSSRGAACIGTSGAGVISSGIPPIISIDNPGGMGTAPKSPGGGNGAGIGGAGVAGNGFAWNWAGGAGGGGVAGVGSAEGGFITGGMVDFGGDVGLGVEGLFATGGSVGSTGGDGSGSG